MVAANPCKLPGSSHQGPNPGNGHGRRFTGGGTEAVGPQEGQLGSRSGEAAFAARLASSSAAGAAAGKSAGRIRVYTGPALRGRALFEALGHGVSPMASG